MAGGGDLEARLAHAISGAEVPEETAVLQAARGPGSELDLVALARELGENLVEAPAV